MPTLTITHKHIVTAVFNMAYNPNHVNKPSLIHDCVVATALKEQLVEKGYRLTSVGCYDFSYLDADGKHQIGQLDHFLLDITALDQKQWHTIPLNHEATFKYSPSNTLPQ